MLRVTAMVLASVLGAGVVPSAGGGTQTPSGATSAPDCSAPEHRQFDFWRGTWTVSSQGKPAGTNSIEADLEGCALVEQWTAANGSRGTSLNYYDRNTRSWYQSWIDDRGGALRLKGGLQNGRMVMQTDPAPGTKGNAGIQRITWSREADGSVRQLWEASRDGGKTWSTVFDGRYVKSQ